MAVMPLVARGKGKRKRGQIQIFLATVIMPKATSLVIGPSRLSTDSRNNFPRRIEMPEIPSGHQSVVGPVLAPSAWARVA